MKFFLFFLSLFFCTFAFSELETVHEYSFNQLTEAGPPRSLRIIPHINETRAIETGILFSYKDRSAKKVYVSGDFSNWSPRVMKRGDNGVWFYFLSEYESRSAVRYKFMVDGIWISDPLNSEAIDDGSGSFLSIAYPEATPENRSVTYRFVRINGTDYVEFRIYNRDASYISVAGDFNNWNPENNQLSKETGNIWRTRVSIPDGKYRYKFIIDGKWSLDLYNSETANDGMNGIASLLIVSPVTKRNIVIQN
ncbi:MAG: glycogen-binding domain-containing protein [Spirochaetes bacterium]|jgi:1,4-alpha-glucan branching enzyme|nr:glycogen-binding domain-containing protein [Spirochaetota bacterium]